MKNLLFSLILVISATTHAQIALEPLYGHLKTSDGIAIQVYSGGCTEKASFNVLKKNVNNIAEIYFIRNTPDYCKALLKYGRLIYFTYEDLGLQTGEQYRLINPEVLTNVVW